MQAVREPYAVSRKSRGRATASTVFCRYGQHEDCPATHATAPCACACHALA